MMSPPALNRTTLQRAYHAEARPYYARLAQQAAQQGGPAPDPEALRRADLEALTGHTSSRDLSASELDLVVRYLRRQGAGDGRSRGGQGDGTDRPTAAQWARMAGLARARGWEGGLEDGRLLAFVVRTTGLAALRFLDRGRATAVITGLERWQAQAVGGAAA